VRTWSADGREFAHLHDDLLDLGLHAAIRADLLPDSEPDFAGAVRVT
jgi:hypothetical protein